MKPMIALGQPDKAKSQVEKSDPKANYMGPQNAPFRCGSCEYFEEPRACAKVSGDIDPEGCCNLFQTQPPQKSLARRTERPAASAASAGPQAPA